MIPFRQALRAAYLTVAGTMVRRLTPGIHILNGHGLSIRNPNASARPFETLLDNLRNCAEFIRIEDATSAVLQGRVVDGVYVAFTFDDGYRECYTDIAPALDRFNVNAAFFVNPGFVDGDMAYQANFFRERTLDIAPRAAMNRSMLIELVAQGFVIGSHTRDHVRLVNLPPTQIEEQVVSSRQQVEAITGVSCDYFAWTYGKYHDIDQRCLDVATATYPYVFSSDRYWEATSKGQRVINRRHFECDWPVSHIKYFLSRSRSLGNLA